MIEIIAMITAFLFCGTLVLALLAFNTCHRIPLSKWYMNKSATVSLVAGIVCLVAQLVNLIMIVS